MKTKKTISLLIILGMFLSVNVYAATTINNDGSINATSDDVSTPGAFDTAVDDTLKDIAEDEGGNPFTEFGNSTEEYFKDFISTLTDTSDGCSNVNCVLLKIIGIIKILIVIVIALSVVTFLWGLVKYVKSVDDKTRQEAVGVITYGIIALFVMVSVWGIVNLISNTFGTESTKTLQTQQVKPTQLIK